MDFAEIARQTVDVLRPFLASGAAGGVQSLAEKAGQEAGRLYEWLKGRLVRPAAAASLVDAVEKPTPSRMESLRTQILTLLEEDESFRSELVALLPRPSAPQRSVHSAGQGNIIIQSVGSGAVISASGGYFAAPLPSATAPPAPTLVPRPPPGAMPSGRHDVFLCHNSWDKGEVTRLAQRLLELGISPWLDVWALRRDQQLQPQLEEAIESIPCLVVFVGPNGTGPWQEQEMLAAVQEFVRRKRGVVVALLEGASHHPELPLFLRDFPRVDLRTWSAGGEPGLRELVAGIFGIPLESIVGPLDPRTVTALRARRG